MSVEAITWALAQPVKQSSAKFVLVVMANRADGDMVCWPSVADICNQTAQDRKTVLENMRRLREAGFIEDTGMRKGSTNQVIVYRLKTPENGTVKQAQKRDEPESGTVPFFPPNSPVFPDKQSRFSHETGPKTGHGTVMEPSIEPSLKPHKGGKAARDDFDAMAYLLQNGVDAQAAKDWLKVRKAKKAPASQTAMDGLAREAAKAGMTLNGAVTLCAERGWASMK